MLVTVSIVCYNSEQYVLETLESVFNQTYNQLELIISDDCSQDTTLKIVNEWILQERVQQRFANTQVLTVPKNTGVSANCNRIIQAAKSDWIKFIAGDDILLTNSIKDYMQFVQEVPQARIVFSQVRVYQNTFEEKNYVRTTPLDFPHNLMDAQWTAKDQYEILLMEDRIHYTPTYFFNKQALLGVGGYDEENRLAEDYPMWLKLTGSGERLYYFHKPTAGYRIHSNAANNTGEEVLFKPSVLYIFEIRKHIAHPHLPWEIVAAEYQQYYTSKFFQMLGLNVKNKFTTIMYRTGCFYLNPFHYVFAIKKRLPKSKKSIFYN